MAKASQSVVTLPAVVDLDALDNVRDALIAAIERGPVVVSAATVERVSTNALARRHDFAFEITAASPAMLGAIARLGFGGHFAAILKG